MKMKKETEFNLSEKEINELGTPLYPREDVKEFIKRLKGVKMKKQELKDEIKNLNDYVRCQRTDLQPIFFARLIRQLDLINSILKEKTK